MTWSKRSAYIGAAMPFVCAAVLHASQAAPSRVTAGQGLATASYSGRYDCGPQPFGFSLTVARIAGGRVDGEARLPSRRVVLSRRGDSPSSPIKVNGSYDAGSQSVSLTSDRGLILVEGGSEARVTFRFRVDPATGYLVGTIDYPGCGDAVLINDAAGNTNFLANDYVMRRRAEAARAAIEAAQAATPPVRPRPTAQAAADQPQVPPPVAAPPTPAAAASATRPANWNQMSAAQQEAWLRDHPAPAPTSNPATRLPLGVRPPATSQIVRVNETEQAPRAPAGVAPLTESGFARGDMLINIYNGRFDLAPAGGLENVSYFAHGLGELAKQCPALGLESSQFTTLPYIISNIRETADRVLGGRGTSTELLTMGWQMLSLWTTEVSCTYDPRFGPRGQAEARCARANALARDNDIVGQLLSMDAAHDITLFLGRHSCTSAETVHFARQMVDFGKQARARLHFVGSMPGPDTPKGRLYMQVFDNCSRRGPDGSADPWCGCYVQTLGRANPSDDLLEALAHNPFVDGGTYARWVAAMVPQAAGIYECASRSGDPDRAARARAPRTTACLVDTRPGNDGDRTCTYRAAWGEFTTTSFTCQPQMTSREWGFREVDCAAGGRETSNAAPRAWVQGLINMIDYESPVPDTFVPALPANAVDRVPLEIRMLKRDTPGLLRAVGLEGVSIGSLGNLAGRDLQRLDADIDAVRREGALLLRCDYIGPSRDVQEERYWFRTVPQHVLQRRYDGAMRPHPFESIRGTATACPLRPSR